MDNRPLNQLPSTGGSASWVDDAPMPSPLPSQTMNAPGLSLSGALPPFGGQGHQFQPSVYDDVMSFTRQIPGGNQPHQQPRPSMMEHFPDSMAANPNQMPYHRGSQMNYSPAGHSQNFSSGQFSSLGQHFSPNYASAGTSVSSLQGSSSSFHSSGRFPGEMQNFHPDFSKMNHQEYIDWYRTQSSDPITTVHVIPTEKKYDPIRYVYDKREAEAWVRVTLRELDFKDNKAEFTTTAPRFVIDGMLRAADLENDTAADRFCLGAYCSSGKHSITNRSIGKGCEVEKLENGDVTVTNLGRAPIFIQCPNYARRNNEEAETVYRIAPEVDPNGVYTPVEQRRMKIFDAAEFPAMVEKVSDSLTFTGLTNQVITRISFVKGFGQKYPNRKAIKDCPIWVELTLTEQLKLIDTKFEELYPPAFG